MKKIILKNQSLINKKYKYELLENGFTNQDILIGKKYFLLKELLWHLIQGILKWILQKKLEQNML